MTRKFTWILIDKLSIGTAPTSKDDIHFLKKKGIKSILSLNASSEIDFIKDIETEFKFYRYTLPDHSSNRIASEREINEVLDILKELLKFSPVFVHCVASVERSPLIAMAWLIREEKLNPDEALRYLMQIHPGTNPLSGQLSILSAI